MNKELLEELIRKVIQEELGKADTQEKFNDVIDNFAKREIEKYHKRKK